ncbi:MAG: SIR2 family protein [Alphaproteobacteria bacterium]|nr:SIR2 family protein [Alphaproteobacteria bacterium]
MTDDALKEAILDANNGAAICFLGAGFSIGATIAYKKEIPQVDELTSLIWDIIGPPSIPNATLTDLAEYCETDDEKKGKLNDLLMKNYTLCIVNEEHKKVLDLPWRAIFTTNFDDLAEEYLKSHQVITPSFDIKKFNTQKKPIYYLHGRARDLLDSQSDPAIVISETAYLEIKEKNRNLYAVLENEIHAASHVFLSDTLFEIQK